MSIGHHHNHLVTFLLKMITRFSWCVVPWYCMNATDDLRRCRANLLIYCVLLQWQATEFLTMRDVGKKIQRRQANARRSGKKGCDRPLPGTRWVFCAVYFECLLVTRIPMYLKSKDPNTCSCTCKFLLRVTHLLSRCNKQRNPWLLRPQYTLPQSLFKLLWNHQIPRWLKKWWLLPFTPPHRAVTA